MRLRGRWLPIVVAGFFACGPPDESKNGGLANGVFAYNCVSGDDPFCPGGNLFGPSDQPFPSAIAVNATFNLGYVPADESTYSSFVVMPVASDFIATTIATPSGGSAGFVGVRPGSPWFYVLTPDGMVLDITSVKLEPVAGIGVTTGAGSVVGSLTETVGSSDTFTASAADANGVALAGDVPFTWSSSNPSVLSVPNAGTVQRSITTFFLKAGSTTVTVSAPGIEESFTVTVVGIGL